MKFIDRQIESIFKYEEKKYIGCLQYLPQFRVKGYKVLFQYDLNFKFEKGDKFQPSNDERVYEVKDIRYDENGSIIYIVKCNEIDSTGIFEDFYI